MSTSKVGTTREPSNSHRAPPEPGAMARVRVRAALRRFRGRIRENKVLNTTWRVAVFIIGVAVVLAGVVMLVTPGPGWLGIIAGFAILASEFVWARRALRRARTAALAARDRALDPRVRKRNQIIGGVLIAIAVAVIVAYIWLYGLTVPWHVDWLRHLP